MYYPKKFFNALNERKLEFQNRDWELVKLHTPTAISKTKYPIDMYRRAESFLIRIHNESEPGMVFVRIFQGVKAELKANSFFYGACQ